MLPPRSWKKQYRKAVLVAAHPAVLAAMPIDTAGFRQAPEILPADEPPTTMQSPMANPKSCELLVFGDTATPRTTNARSAVKNISATAAAVRLKPWPGPNTKELPLYRRQKHHPANTQLSSCDPM